MNYEGPIWHWVVRFVYRASRYFDSPLYRCRGGVCFWTKEEADAFIANPGPEYPHFELVAVYREAIPQLKHTGISANESAMRPQCTDEMLIR